MFTFTPLLGAQSSSRASQSILELDGEVKILIDVGWDEGFDTKKLNELEKHTSSLSFILLTHSTFSHIGAFAYCCKNIPNFTQIPIYATSPVIAFGRTLLQDLYSSTPLAATFIPETTSAENDDTLTNDGSQRSNILRQPPTHEEINKYFSLITPLKYSQPLQPASSQFSPGLEGLTLTAYNSGHTLGGTIWHIQHGMESIVYAIDWNQARENVIAGASWFGGVGGSEVIEQLRKPTALVCSSIGGDEIALSGGRKTRDEALINHIRSAIAKGGTILIPTDSSARILELAWILEKAWQDGGNELILKNTMIYLASKSGNTTLRYARSLLEWMDDSIVREFEGDDENTKSNNQIGGNKTNGSSKTMRPFQFKHITILEKRSRLDKVLRSEGPKVILASDLSMNWGYAKNIFEIVSQKTENLIILTEKYNHPITNKMSPNQQLWQWFKTRQDGVALEKTIDGDYLEQVHSGGRTIQYQSVEKLPLDIQDVQIYQQFLATQRQIFESFNSTNDQELTGADDHIDDDTSSSSSDSDDEQQGRALNVSTALGHGTRNKLALSDEDLGVNILIRKNGIFDVDVRNKKGRNALFPYTHSKKRGDEFGDVIKPEDFLREEEKEEQQTESTNKMYVMVGPKRKWHEKEVEPSNKLPKINEQSMGQNGDVQAAEDSDDSDVEQIDEIHTPSKVVFSNMQFNVNARLAFVDFAGLHDQRSLQMMIPLIGPKKLILVGGSSQETMSLASDCKELLQIKVTGSESQSATEILTPSEGQIVDASVDTNAWTVKLTRGLAKKLQWQNVRNLGVVTLQGQLKGEVIQLGNLHDDPKTKKQKIDTELSKESLSPSPIGVTSSSSSSLSSSSSMIAPILDILPANLAASTRSITQPILVGDMRLADLRKLMNMDGHLAEFRGEGILLIDGMIAVKKIGTGKIIVEGMPINSMNSITTRSNDNFTRVKQKIYEGLAVVATG